MAAFSDWSSIPRVGTEPALSSSSSSSIAPTKLDIDQANRILNACGGKPGPLTSNTVKLKIQVDSNTEKVIKVTAKKLAKHLGLRASEVKQKAKEGSLESYIADKLKRQIRNLRKAEVSVILQNYNNFYEKHKVTKANKLMSPEVFARSIRIAHRVAMDSKGQVREVQNIGGVNIKRTEPTEDNPEGRIRSYKWMTPIGHGGFGVVFAVFDLISAREYALKVAKTGVRGASDDIHNEQVVLRLLNEGGPHTGVQEAGTGKTREGRYKGPLYSGDLNSLNLLMFNNYKELVAAGSDSSFEAKIMGVAKKRVCQQLIQGLLFCHEKGIRCGDIKPGNILWKYSDTTPKTIQAVLSDFGGAEKFEDLHYYFNELIINQGTDTPVPGYGVVGTHTRAYISNQDLSALKKPMSLEDFRKHSEARDVYALGCTMYEFFMAEKPPKKPVEIDGTIVDVVTAEAFWKESYRKMVAAGVSPDIVEIIQRMLESDYRQRPTGEELRALWAVIS